MPRKFYRAVKTLTPAELGEVHHWRPTMRLPSNVPYIVDNLWENLRPANMPCRRHAVYVSPSPVLAIECAARTGERSMYTAYEVEISGSFTITQLDVEDARYHSDVSAVLGLVKAEHATWHALPWATQLCLGMLFAAGCTKAMWARLAHADKAAARLIEVLSSESTFWTTAHRARVECRGELFFELGNTSCYRLRLKR